MRLEGELLLIVPAIGIAIATLALVAPSGRARAPAFALAGLLGIAPLISLARPEAGRATGRALWEWSTIGGPLVHAAYHVDPLAVIGAVVVALVSIAALRLAAAEAGRHPALPALILAQGLALLALVSVTDIVAAALVAGIVASFTAAIGFLVARPPSAARLTALLALGVQSFTATALLVGRFGIATFDLDSIPAAAIGPDALAAMALGAALFCGLYPFVPWRYDPAGRELARAALRGALTFPTGVAGTVLALRVFGATDRAPTAFALPDVGDATRLTVALAVLGATAAALIAARRASTQTILARAGTGAVLLAFVLAYPSLRWSHVVAALSLLTVAYASLASVAIPGEWAVARFDARLGTLWAAIALGTPAALAGALFGSVASTVALVIEASPWRSRFAPTASVLASVGPFAALLGVPGTADTGVAVLAGAALLWSGVVETGHALRTVNASSRAAIVRVLDALAAYGTVVLLGLVSASATAAVTRDVLPATLRWPTAYALSLAIVFAAVTVVVAAAPRLAAAPRVPAAAVRATLAAADPVPGALLTYRAVERLSSRFAAGFALLEERAGVWLATLLIAATLIWAATS